MVCHEPTGQGTRLRTLFSISYELLDSACCFFEPFKRFQKGTRRTLRSPVRVVGLGSHSFWFELLYPLFNCNVRAGFALIAQFGGIHASLQRLQRRRLAQRFASQAVTTDRTAQSLRLGFWVYPLFN